MLNVNTSSNCLEEHNQVKAFEQHKAALKSKQFQIYEILVEENCLKILNYLFQYQVAFCKRKADFE